MASNTLIYAMPIATTHGHFAYHKSLSLYSARTFWLITTSSETLQNVDYSSKSHSVPLHLAARYATQSLCAQKKALNINTASQSMLTYSKQSFDNTQVYQQIRRGSPHNNFWATYILSISAPQSPEVDGNKGIISEMGRMGICSKSSSPCASPLHMVSKSDGSWRPCCDYRRLNIITEPDHYPMPNIMDIINSIGSARVFTKLDLHKENFQVHVHPADLPNTAIITPFGNYGPLLYVRSQEQRRHILAHNGFYILTAPHCLMDDLLAFLDNNLEHELHLVEVHSILRENGLNVRPLLHQQWTSSAIGSAQMTYT